MGGRLLSRPLDVERLGVDKAFPLLRISPAVPDYKDTHQMLMPIRISISISDKTVGRTEVLHCGSYSRPAIPFRLNLILEINREFAF
jgi:hypothetical protein